MYTRKTALSLAIQARTCPLQRIVDDPSHARQNREHLAVCPFCSTGRSGELDACRDLAASLKQRISIPPSRPVVPAPGQIWQLNPALACWRDRFYYWPPAVVILQGPEPGQNHILAAQIWHDIYLAGPGDLVATPEDAPWDSPVFIETWNIYTLARSYLAHYLGCIPPNQTADILRMNQDPDYLPYDAVTLLPLEENDPRHYFRKMELETGYTFARTAARDLLNEPAEDPVTALMAQIRKIVPGATFSWPPRTVEECFATLEFPAESLALAAADQDHEKLVATHLRLSPDPEEPFVTKITPFYCVIFSDTNTTREYTVTGTLADLRFDLEKTRFSCYLADSTAQTLEKGTIRIDPKTHAFIADFQRPRTHTESLCIVAEEGPA